MPYGSTRLSLNLADEQIAGVLESNITDLKAEGSEDDIVVAAMAAPFGGKTLKEMAQGKKDATIIISDHTRLVPSKHIIPFMLKELLEGNPDIDVTLLVATGFYRLTVKEELVNKLGEKIVAEEKIIVHDSANADANVKIGVLPSGADLIINKVAAEADLLVAEGFIEHHFFAGFSGGRKSVLPGVSDWVTVLGNHCGAFIASDHARTGVLEENHIHKDMKSASQQANMAYIVNTVIDEDKKVVAAFAGDPFTANDAGCEFLRGYCKVDAIPADIVITSNGGAPLDQNMYQCVKSMTAAEASAGEDGVIILCAECADGTGGEGFYRALKDCESPAALMEEILQVPQDQTKPDQWECQIQDRILMQHPIIYVSRPEMQQTIEEMKMIYAPDLETAMAMAKEIKWDNAKFTVIPNGIAVIVSQ
ncbi:nickel-dependent lactate racemase [Eubacterium aggregans]|uniref:nickel-dependent lactate racemase n=1 Tax=Eubacterium aggregans TaxID=81409 RepID=UPI003F3161FF